MAFTPKTGNTGTIAFATSNLSLVITEISEATKSVPVLNGSHLGTTNQQESYPGDLAELSEVTVTTLFNPGINLAALGTSETITITYPKCNAGTNAGIWAGTGFIRQVGTARMVNGTLMTSQIIAKYDGLTEAAFTKEA